MSEMEGADVRIAPWSISRWTATVSWARRGETVVADVYSRPGTRGGLVPWRMGTGNALYCLLVKV